MRRRSELRVKRLLELLRRRYGEAQVQQLLERWGTLALERGRLMNALLSRRLQLMSVGTAAGMLSPDLQKSLDSVNVAD